MYENCHNDKAQDLPFQLTDMETLLTLARSLPMLHELNDLMKVSQNRTMYIAKYTNARKLACFDLDNLYTMLEYFNGIGFTSWTRIINIKDIEIFFRFDEKGILCIMVYGNMVSFHYISKIRRTIKECLVSRDQFDNIVISVRLNLTQPRKENDFF